MLKNRSVTMTKQQFLEYCLSAYGTSSDNPFDEDFETAVLRHEDNRKWYAIVMKVSRRKFGVDSDELIDVVNLKLPTEMFGSFGAVDGVCEYGKCRIVRDIAPDSHWKRAKIGRIARTARGVNCAHKRKLAGAELRHIESLL